MVTVCASSVARSVTIAMQDKLEANFLPQRPSPQLDCHLRWRWFLLAVLQLAVSKRLCWLLTPFIPFYAFLNPKRRAFVSVCLAIMEDSADCATKVYLLGGWVHPSPSYLNQNKRAPVIAADKSTFRQHLNQPLLHYLPRLLTHYTPTRHHCSENTHPFSISR